MRLVLLNTSKCFFFLCFNFTLARNVAVTFDRGERTCHAATKEALEKPSKKKKRQTSVPHRKIDFNRSINRYLPSRPCDRSRLEAKPFQTIKFETHYVFGKLLRTYRSVLSFDKVATMIASVCYNALIKRRID